MNVTELMQRLDDFGGHVPVVVVVEQTNGMDKPFKEFDADDRHLDGELVFALTVTM